MRPLKLHVKTTLLAAALIIVVLAATLWLFSYRTRSLIQREQKEAATAQALALAEHLSHLPAPRDAAAIASAVGFASALWQDEQAVRVWARAGDVFAVTVASANSPPARALSPETIEALRGGQAASVIYGLNANEAARTLSIFAPVTEPDPQTKQERVSGAVEVVVNLESLTSLASQYLWNEIVVFVTALLLAALGFYLLFRAFVHRPFVHLLRAMAQAESGDLNARAAVATGDEIGQLAGNFNRMMGEIGAMTSEREAQQEILRERVRLATGEISARNRQLSDANRQLWHITRQLTQMERLAAAGQTAAQFAHEVGTPLNLISGHIQLLRRTAATQMPEAAPRLDIIGAQITRIEGIVRNMLERTRPAQLELQPLDLNDLLQRLSEATQPLLEARGVSLTLALAENLPPINGNYDRLQQVFINLFNNALDAMPDGGALSVTTKTEGAEQLLVLVADNGGGMAEDVKAHIFDPLFTTKRRGRGTGLGLVVVRQAMQEHIGSIEVESAPQQGATFSLRFPVAHQ